MRHHTTLGAEILAGSRSPLLQVAEVIARTHHERWDGSGYPAGLRGEEIPLPGRIAAVCDVFDALTSERAYKQRWTVRDALDEIVRERGRHFDPRLVDLFVALLEPAAPRERERERERVLS
jgi:putative two-component system response regulator